MIKFTLGIAIIGLLAIAAIGSVSVSVKPVFVAGYGAGL